jgi:hypothetical protein
MRKLSRIDTWKHKENFVVSSEDPSPGLKYISSFYVKKKIEIDLTKVISFERRNISFESALDFYSVAE